MDVFQKCTESAARPDSMRAAGVYPYYRVISVGPGSGRPARRARARDAGLEQLPRPRQPPRGQGGRRRRARDVRHRAAPARGCSTARSTSTSSSRSGSPSSRGARPRSPSRPASRSTSACSRACSAARDVAILDALDHACIIDGCRLGFGKILQVPPQRHGGSRAQARRSPRATRQADRGGRRVLDGGRPRAAARDRRALKRRYGARLMVDDAHGLGVFGEHGRGTPEHFGVEAEVDLRDGHVLEVARRVGGFVAGRRAT